MSAAAGSSRRPSATGAARSIRSTGSAPAAHPRRRAPRRPRPHPAGRAARLDARDPRGEVRTARLMSFWQGRSVGPVENLQRGQGSETSGPRSTHRSEGGPGAASTARGCWWPSELARPRPKCSHRWPARTWLSAGGRQCPRRRPAGGGGRFRGRCSGRRNALVLETDAASNRRVRSGPWRMIGQYDGQP